MVEQTLGDIRQYIEGLATEGPYYLVCARHGDSPVPADGLRFADRATARAAARATERYRTQLRQYDERLPCYDVVVCQEVSCRREPDPPASEKTDWRLSDRVVGSSPDDRQARIRFCHRVATAVFEALADREYDAAERAVLAGYYDLAEVTSDPNSLCVQLLERMALVLDDQLTPPEQAELLTDAAARLPATTASDQPVATTLSLLETHGLLDGYTVSTDDSRQCHVRLSGYRLSPQEERLPILPIVLELTHLRPEASPPSFRVAGSGDRWELRLGAARASPRVTAPINAEV